MKGPEVAWDIEPDVDERRETSSNLLDFVLMAGLPINSVFAAVGYPLPEVAALALCGVALFRRPTRGLKVPAWFPVLLLAVPGWLAISSYLNGIEGTRRLGHLAAYTLLAYFLATGRIQRLAAARGLAVGLGIVIVVGLLGRFAGIGPDPYPGRMTGLISDPNTLGYTVGVLGPLAMTGARPGFRRVVGAFSLIGSVLLTLSRTAITGLLVGIVWVALRRFARSSLALVAAAAGAVYAEEMSQYIDRLMQASGFFVDRTGSDLLRDRIVAAEEILLAQRPWTGHGAGTAQVTLPQGDFFFHNSYLALRCEGGWIGLALLLAVVGLVFVALLRLPHDYRHPLYEASLIVALIMAATLGEVLLEMPTAVALGMGMRHALVPDELVRADHGELPDHVL